MASHGPLALAGAPRDSSHGVSSQPLRRFSGGANACMSNGILHMAGPSTTTPSTSCAFFVSRHKRAFPSGVSSCLTVSSTLPFLSLVSVLRLARDVKQKPSNWCWPQSGFYRSLEPLMSCSLVGHSLNAACQPSVCVPCAAQHSRAQRQPHQNSAILTFAPHERRPGQFDSDPWEERCGGVLGRCLPVLSHRSD
ncbi:hypothetical protein NLU13_5520 [Sarocladium strictum]|uniref:Uncharacterized protein n=1 Tax=Sarocladium strictum TaxID=5046 RepID=A0AA39GJJ6_SARSR|nr:hypothetical protein NLU13_5520 [Sarocladium strictum]